jgi:predicted NBD/HSP70 family sugar kinase
VHVVGADIDGTTIKFVAVTMESEVLSDVRTSTQRMERAGFLERRQDTRDQRISRVYLTQAGCTASGAPTPGGGFGRIHPGGARTRGVLLPSDPR